MNPYRPNFYVWMNMVFWRGKVLTFQQKTFVKKYWCILKTFDDLSSKKDILPAAKITKKTGSLNKLWKEKQKSLVSLNEEIEVFRVIE